MKEKKKKTNECGCQILRAHPSLSSSYDTFTKGSSLNSCKFGSAIVWKPTDLRVPWKRFKKRLLFPANSEYSAVSMKRG
ncbi:hypothetical protein CY34DRAFT_811937 [Suillus luteus UH-Slu-Lm8-n1]|uniref:Uncharacterized protein n=1 Tax=Suillus luteus UH-Slu-Lm8-n1 TaxID=930992 RepID=A0A0D0A1S3_9AGAM|nr:hypothetical protein CY34DRAFT_811937 [Suillus luteus UH-Slu-Lm8-n1]